MVKERPMRWTPRGARLLLQVRTHVLNDQLAGDFRRWYPGFNQAPDPAVLTGVASTLSLSPETAAAYLP